MDKNIPSDKQVLSSLKRVLESNHVVGSQNKLKNLVDKDLGEKTKSDSGVSPARLRNLAIDSDFVKIEIHSREGDPKKIMYKCPVCEGNLKRVKNKTIWGGKVTIEFQCPVCGYWTGKKKRIPTRYVFYYKK